VYPLQVVLGPLARLLVGAGRALTPRGKGDRDGPFSTEVELRQLVDLAEQGEVIDPEERQMIHSVFKLDDTSVREVMVPRPDIVFTGRDADADAVLSLAMASGYSRIPVTGEDEDDVVGIVYLKDLVERLRDRWAAAAGGADDVPLTAGHVMRDATFVPDTKPIDELLREMQKRRNHVAVAIDEYGGTAGLVTLEDIVEEIVGEITDEYDHEIAPVDWLDDDRLRVTARLPLGELAELFPERDLEVSDVETVGGLVAFVLGRVPAGGAQAEYAGLRLTLEGKSSRRNRMTTVLVERLAPEGDQGPDHDVRSTDQ
jgi:CBS domain containing-hemolysin-like protein